MDRARNWWHDAFSHQAEGMKMFGGITVNAEVQDFSGMTSLGVETIAPIVRRGVLIDVAGAAGTPIQPRQLIGADELASAAAAASVTPRPGDVVLVRLGWGSRWNNPADYLSGPGMDRGVYIVENLLLDELAQAGVVEFLFACLPLKNLGGTASPVRPVAVVPRA